MNDNELDQVAIPNFDDYLKILRNNYHYLFENFKKIKN